MKEACDLPTAYPQEFAYAVGTHVYFRYFTKQDAEGDWHLWFNSPAVMKNVISQRWTNTPDNQVAYLETLTRSRDRLAVAIVDRRDDTLIGVGSLSKIDVINRHAEMSCIIGSGRHRDGIHALESLAMLTEIGLVRLNLNKLVATGLETSEDGLQMTKLLGYTESGRIREHGFVDGRYVDCIILEMFQRDWLTSPKRPKSISWVPYKES